MAENGVYDVVGAFQNIEEELITSMNRNMRKHIGDQTDENINWTQWQAEMLKGLDVYKQENADKLKGYYSTINEQIEDTIRKAEQLGESEAEIEILKKLQEGESKHKYSNGVDGSFFRVNERKMNALVNSTTNDFEQAEKAILRTTNDRYRQIVFNAQVFYNSGAGSLEKAIDMASKSFLAAGINCIEYKNGARVNVASYAEMAMRTANKRANLVGAATKREEYGIHTVKITAHGSACPLCVQWQGRVYIDDVYGGGTSAEGKESGYPMLSEAVAGGMFHPNCKNGLSTYFEGISKPPKEPTAEETEEMGRRYDLEQQQRYCERQIRKYKRLSSGSMDAGNAAKYKDKEKQWMDKYNDLIKRNQDVLRKDSSRLKLYGINS